MDEMRMKLSTRFMKCIVAKMISKAVYKKFGCKTNIQINDLDVWIFDGDTTVKANVEVKLSSGEFTKIMKSFDE